MNAPIKHALVLALAPVLPASAQMELVLQAVMEDGGNPKDARAADLDLDGDLDLVVLNESNESVYVHLNPGGGAFVTGTPGVVVPLSSTGWQLEVGDMNGDCYPDIVVSGHLEMKILLADGVGGYVHTTSPHTLSGYLPNFALFDPDNDGDLDIVGARTSVARVRVLFNDGAANFTEGPFLLGDTLGIEVGDFNGDGNEDVFVGKFFDYGAYVHRGNGMGGFSRIPACNGPFNPGTPVVGDMTGDGILDVALSSDDGGGSTAVYRGTGSGTFVLEFANAWTRAWFTHGDFDGDGWGDLAIGDYENQGYQQLLLRPDGNGGLDSPVPFSTRFQTAADFDGDGLADLARGGTVYLNRSSFWDASPVNGNSYRLLATQDWKEAELRAVSLGGHLATVLSAAENQWLAAHFATEAFIGYTDTASEGQFEWTSGAPSGYENWAPGEPDDQGDSDFTRLAPSGLWYDEPITTQLRGLAEVKSADCDQNGKPDAFEIAQGWVPDINGDGVPDSCASPYYCSAEANSSGSAASIAFTGTPAAGVDTVHLAVTDMPQNQFGYFLMADSQDNFPMVGGGQGTLCLGLPFVRFASHVLNSGASGAVSFTPDLVNVPGGVVIEQGSTWNFQCWFRDQNPAATSNLSNAVQLTFSADPRPQASFSETCSSLEEQAVQFDVQLELSFAYHEDVVLPYTTGGTATYGVDWRVESHNPLVIPAGQTSATLTITVAEDAAPEITETGLVRLAPSPTVRVGAVGEHGLVIRDDD